ncbi:MAG: chloride channel protein [Bryobacteraceae bacterium]
MKWVQRLNPFAMAEEHRFLLLAILIGISGGLLVVCFHVVIEFIRWYLLGIPVGHGVVRTILAPAFGGLAGTALIVYVFRSARGSGVNQTKAAIYISDGILPPQTILGKFLACSLTIGTGNSLGPEDPALQMGAAAASWLGQVFRLTRDNMRRIAPVGAAAGLAAAFNTPITAVLFVMEEVIGSWNAQVLGSIVLSAVSAVVVSRWFLGNEPLFHVPRFTLTHPSELIVYAMIGAVTGLLAALFTRTAGWLKSRVAAHPGKVTLYAPMAAGLVVGFVGLWLPQVLGSGYQGIDSALHNRFTWQFLLALAMAKIVVTLLCFSAGTPGGMFAPTVFTGAMIGGGMGALAQHYWPAPVSAPSAYVLVGIGTFFAGIFRAPMTSVFMVFEVSASYVIIVPVMVANIVSYLVSRRLQPEAFADLIARHEGLDLPSLEHEREQRALRVEDAMQPPPWPVLGAESPGPEALELAARLGWGGVLVREGKGAWGWVDSGQLGEGTLGETAVPVSAPRLYRDLSLDTALRRFGPFPALPVVSRANADLLVGVLTLADIRRTYGIAGETGSPMTYGNRNGAPGSESSPASQA